MLDNCHGERAASTNLPSDVVTSGDLLSKEGYMNTYLGK
jgi:arylsulfatase A-like enzyme